MPRELYGVSNPMVVQQARDALRGELEKKGFRFVSDPAVADFVVDYTIGSRKRVEIQSLPVPYAGPWWNLESWWGSPYWGPQVDVRVYREGTLSVDVFDARSHRPVWHGWAGKELTQLDIDRPQGPIRAAVRSILKKFPPRWGRGLKAEIGSDAYEVDAGTTVVR